MWNAKRKKDHYGVLGVLRDASDAEIRKAYRDRVRKCHPDKGHGRDAAATDIYDLNEAYEVLGDPEKRRAYDAGDMGTEFMSDTMMSAVVDLLVGAMKRAMKNAENRTARQTPSAATPPPTGERPETERTPTDTTLLHDTIELCLHVSLEDLQTRRIKKLVVSRRMLDGSTEKKTLYLSLYNYEPEYVFEGQGDQIDADKFGDVRVLLIVDAHPEFVIDTIDRYDLWTERDIGLYDYYHGKTFDIVLLDGTVCEVKVPAQMERDDMVVVLENKGLPFYDEESDIEMYGNLYVRLVLVLKRIDPDVLEREDVRDVLSFFL